MGSFPEQAHYFLRPKFHLKALRQLRELTTFSGNALEHVDCAIYNLEKQSVDNVVYVVVDMMMIKGTMMLLMLSMMMMMMMMMIIKGTMMLLMLPMVMMMTVMMVEMKRVLRDLVTMMRFRTFLHKESCNLFSSIKFNNIRQQILNL